MRHTDVADEIQRRSRLHIAIAGKCFRAILKSQTIRASKNDLIIRRFAADECVVADVVTNLLMELPPMVMRIEMQAQRLDFLIPSRDNSPFSNI